MLRYREICLLIINCLKLIIFGLYFSSSLILDNFFKFSEISLYLTTNWLVDNVKHILQYNTICMNHTVWRNFINKKILLHSIDFKFHLKLFLKPVLKTLSVLERVVDLVTDATDLARHRTSLFVLRFGLKILNYKASHDRLTWCDDMNTHAGGWSLWRLWAVNSILWEIL